MFCMTKMLQSVVNKSEFKLRHIIINSRPLKIYITYLITF